MAMVACLAGYAPSSSAQNVVEITPFFGYRFGGDFFELVTEQPVDEDGAPAFGVAVDIGGRNGLYFEGLYSRQNAYLSTPARPETPIQPAIPATRWHITVDQYHAGALQEFRYGRMRPFLQSTFGLARYAADNNAEMRFSIGVGGGVKLFPTSNLGVRLDGRSFITFTDAEGEALACTVGVCLFALDVDVVWQAEFTAAVVVRFP